MDDLGRMVVVFVTAAFLTFVLVLTLGCAAPGTTGPVLMEQSVPGPLPYTPGRHPVRY